MASTALLEGANLRKTYRLGRDTTVEALRGVDVRIEPGEMVAIMGPSGSGKSTLMHILGLLHAPDLNHGPRPELRFEGRDIVALSDAERTRIRARRMGFVFQDFNLVPTLTALENVMLACDYAGIRRRGRAGGGPRGARPRGPGRQGRSSPGRAFRRRAAARRDRPRAGEPAVPRPGRRADRQPGLRALRRRPGAPAQVQPRARPDVRARDPRRGGRRGLRPRRAHARRARPGPGACLPWPLRWISRPAPPRSRDVRSGACRVGPDRPQRACPSPAGLVGSTR